MSDAAAPVVIIGTGGHARVIARLLALAGRPVAGLLDRRSADPDERIGGHAVVGTFTEWPTWAARGVAMALALGDNAERADWHARLSAAGVPVIGVRHPSAIVEADAQVAADAVVCAGAIIGTAATIEADVLINTGAIVEHECRVAAHAHVASGVRLAGRVQVGCGAFVGAGAVVRDGVRIGAGAIIGAGAVVLRDVPAGVVVVGVPAAPRPDLSSPWPVAA